MAPSELLTPKTNALARRLYAEQFLRQEGHSSPQELIDAHEAWLISEFALFDAPINDMTWRVFHDSTIDYQKASEVPYSFKTLESRVVHSTRNILQSLAWHHAPETASWNKPQINFRPTSEVLVNHSEITRIAQQRAQIDSNRWWGPMERYKSYMRGCQGIGCSSSAPFIFEVNEHYEGMNGSIRYNEPFIYGRKPTGVKCLYLPESGIFEVAFSNPSDFMGWYDNGSGNLEYRLTHLNRLLADLNQAISMGETGVIAIDTFDAYRRESSE